MLATVMVTSATSNGCFSFKLVLPVIKDHHPYFALIIHGKMTFFLKKLCYSINYKKYLNNQFAYPCTCSFITHDTLLFDTKVLLLLMIRRLHIKSHTNDVQNITEHIPQRWSVSCFFFFFLKWLDQLNQSHFFFSDSAQSARYKNNRTHSPLLGDYE